MLALHMHNTILITGGTGLVGTYLTHKLLALNYTIHYYTRTIPLAHQQLKGVQYFTWNPAAGTYDAAALQGVSSIINLAGAGVADQRWTPSRKQVILESRTNSAATLTKALLETKHEVHTIIQASATGWYYAEGTIGNTYPNAYQEAEPAHNDFLGTTCQAWEAGIQALKYLPISICTVRIGIVLSSSGGMVKELMLPMKLKVLPIFGNGKQLVPWVHIQDLAGIMLYAIQHKITGTYNAVANSTPQKVLVKHIAKALNLNTWLAIPIPEFLLKIILGEMTIELIKSVNVSNKKIIDAGYVFKYNHVQAIDQLSS